MPNIIIVFHKKEVALKIKNILQQNGLAVSAVCRTGSRAIQLIEEMDAGVIVSGVRYADMVYHELREYLPEFFEMIVIANRQQWKEYGENDVIFLPLPMKAFDLADTVEDVCADLERRLKRKRLKPRTRSADEQMIIDRAKRVLMDNNGYTEEAAHRYMQKQSMDSGNSLVDIAYMILDMF